MTETTTTKTTNLGTQAVADHYGVDRKTVLAWTQRGCPVKRSGRINRFDLVAVDRWLLANGKPATGAFVVPTDTTEEVTHAAND